MITGNEVVHPEITTDLEASGLQNTYSYGGITLKQLALKDFMCALINNLGIFAVSKDVAERANELTNAYIEQLNK